WSSHWLFNHVTNKIKDYYTPEVNDVAYYINRAVPPPVKGRSRDAMYALPWYGLDGETGLPKMYVNGEETENFTTYYRSFTPENLPWTGVNIPPYYGSIRNDFEWKKISLSIMMTWKAGHKFRLS